MPDIDMIPRSWRDGIRVRRTLRRTAVALAIVVVAAAAANAALRWRSAAIERQAAALTAAAAQARSDQARDAMAREAKEQRMRQEALLRTLRREGELAAFALAIDSALPPDAWLTGIGLRRDFQAPVAATGAGTSAAAPGDAPAPGSVVELAGEAMNYEAVTTFLAQLGRAPGVATVQLQSSGAGTETRAIGFHAVVTLAWRDGH
ncbi:MAG TPA: PilN domain-containing protein [Pseudoduganella sp.]